VITAYAILFGGFRCSVDRLADILGRRRILSSASQAHNGRDHSVVSRGLPARLIVFAASRVPRRRDLRTGRALDLMTGHYARPRNANLALGHLGRGLRWRRRGRTSLRADVLTSYPPGRGFLPENVPVGLARPLATGRLDESREDKRPPGTSKWPAARNHGVLMVASSTADALRGAAGTALARLAARRGALLGAGFRGDRAGAESPLVPFEVFRGPRFATAT